MYPLKSCVANIEYFIESSALRNVPNFSTYEWKNYVLQLVRLESCFPDPTELYSGKCITPLSLAKKMHLSTLKHCLSSRKSFVNNSRHLKFLQLTWKSEVMDVIHGPFPL